MALVQIITTGGTIASRADPATGAAVPVVSGDELLASVPQLAAVAATRVCEFSQMSSWNMTPALMADLARAARTALDDPAVAGVVVTHGTDTMEESAFALELVLDSPKPVVFTGAMRHAGQPFPDGPRNLLVATQVAAAPAARGVGVVVVMHDEIHAARYVTKTHTTALDALRSPATGPIGAVDDSGVWLRCLPPRLPRLPLVDPVADVFLVRMATGLSDRLIRAVLEGGGRGLVIEGSGSGNVYGGWEAAIGEVIAADVPVVLVSRTGGGRVAPGYGGAGGGRTLVDRGVIPGGDLSGPKARLALMFALGAGWSNDRIRAWFAAVTDNDSMHAA